MSKGEIVFFLYVTNIMTAIGMVMLLLMVIGSFYLLICFLNEKVKLKFEQKAGSDGQPQTISSNAAEVHSGEQPDNPDGRRRRRHMYDRGVDGQGRIFLGIPHSR